MRIRVTRPLGAGNARYHWSASLAACGAAAANSPVSRTGLRKKTVFPQRLRWRPRSCIASGRCSVSAVRAFEFQERFMSFSVNGSNTNNPAALWQSLMSPNSSASGTAVRSAVGAAGDARPGNAATSSNSARHRQTVRQRPRALRPRNSVRRRCRRCLICRPTARPRNRRRRSSAAMARRTRPIRLRRSKPSRAKASTPITIITPAAQQSASDMFASAESATSQTTANSNGSSTTTITYADGSSVTLNTAPPSTSSSSSASATSSSGSANVAGNNFLEQLIQMQAQLVAPAASQNSVTV